MCTHFYQSINQSMSINQSIYCIHPSIHPSSHPSIPINYHRFIACHNCLLAPLCPLRIPRNCSEPSRDFFQGSSEIALFEGSWGQRRGNKGSLKSARCQASCDPRNAREAHQPGDANDSDDPQIRQTLHTSVGGSALGCRPFSP